MHRLNSHRLRAWYYLALYCSLLALLTCAISAHAAQGDFTIIHLPDTQFYSRDSSTIFSAQTQWILNNKNLMNIAYEAISRQDAAAARAAMRTHLANSRERRRRAAEQR